jgi:hypothetical protein
MILSQLESTKVDLGKPVFTLDVHGVALRPPSAWPSEMQALAPLEWNYFKTDQVELCVTPELRFEITQGQALADLPWPAYLRYKKSQLFKSRPSGTTLSLNEQEANNLWNSIREILWPSVPAGSLQARQRADVSEVYFHTISNSTVANSAFLTCDRNTLSYAPTLRGELGINAMTFNEAWAQYQPACGLSQPSQDELDVFLREQPSMLYQLSTRSSG